MTQFDLLAIHIGAGAVAIVCGFAALFAPKGRFTHRAAGSVFTVSMTVAALSASYLGYRTGDANDVAGGVLTAYLVVTAWAAARRKDGQAGLFEIAAFLLAAAGAGYSYIIARSAEFQGAAYVFTGVIALAALLDLSVVLRRGLSGRQRIARHLWRMSLGLFIAAGSFFLGQMQVFPESLRRLELLAIPPLLVIVLMAFWLIRVLFTGWLQKT